MQRCRCGADVAEVQMWCRGADKVLSAEVQGAEVQFCRGDVEVV